MNSQQCLEEDYYDDVKHPPEMAHNYTPLTPILPPPIPSRTNVQQSDDYISVIGDDILDAQNGDQTAIDVPKQQPKRMRCCKKLLCWSVVIMGIQSSLLLALVVVVIVFVGGSTMQTKSGNSLEKTRVGHTSVYRDCQDALEKGQTASGVYIITPEEGNSFAVYCDQEIDQGGWVVFQQRRDGSVNFYKTWDAYTEGFGNLMGEMWLGNKYLHSLTKQQNTELKVELTSPEGEVEYANYSSFSIEDEANNFRLHVSGYTGGDVPGDSLSSLSGKDFSTRDVDNDIYSLGSCAKSRNGAWWFSACGHINVNGKYGGSRFEAVFWYDWEKYKSLKGTRMLVRRT